MAILGSKRKREGASDVPLSALAARKARQPVAPPVVRQSSPDVAFSPVEPEPAESPSSSSEDEQVAIQVEALVAEVVRPKDRPERRQTRYFAAAVAPPAGTPPTAEVDWPAAPTTPAKTTAPAPAAAAPTRRRNARIDPLCTSTWQPRPGENLHVVNETVTIRLTGEEVRAHTGWVNLALSALQTLILRGVCTITIGEGSISTNGANVAVNQRFELFATSLFPLPVLRASDSTQGAVITCRPLHTGIEGIGPSLYASDMIGRNEAIWSSSPTTSYLPAALGFDIARLADARSIAS
jgi:hypothetical protein